MKYAVEYVGNFVDIVDINFGCPAPKIVKNGDGSRLLQNLDLLEDAFSSFKEQNNHIFFEGQIYDAYSLMKKVMVV